MGDEKGKDGKEKDEKGKDEKEKDEKGKDEKEKAKVSEVAAKDMAKVLDGPLKGEEQIAKIGEIVDAAEGKMAEKEKDEKGKDEKEKENVIEDVAKVLDLELD